MKRQGGDGREACTADCVVMRQRVREEASDVTAWRGGRDKWRGVMGVVRLGREGRGQMGGSDGARCLETLGRATTGLTRPAPAGAPRLHTTGNHDHTFTTNVKVFKQTHMKLSDPSTMEPLLQGASVTGQSNHLGNADNTVCTNTRSR
ncbi:hypothetical protein E2C01_022236 [Portunus trituberculatus]|uniref:Uncharacterized protein n=1 Tax=Portunus trituberculatus TaxID=210409 RepID=A0A5B7E4U9_PORTR|nr:hypothetical protein [Portunus trituberculatus]